MILDGKLMKRVEFLRSTTDAPTRMRAMAFRSRMPDQLHVSRCAHDYSPDFRNVDSGRANDLLR